MFSSVRVSLLRVLILTGLMGLASFEAVSASPAPQAQKGSPQGVPQGITSGGTSGFTVVDAPGAGAGQYQGTGSLRIDAAGDIAGIYLDASNEEHAYLRLANGTVAAVEPPVSTSGANRGAVPLGFDTAGDLAGIYMDANSVLHGFIRSAATGAITVFDVPGAGANEDQGTFPICIDAGGDIAGSYTDVNNVPHGFLRTANGSISSFDAAGGDKGTGVVGINTAGEVVGSYLDANDVVHGFVRAVNGAITPINAPNAGTGSEQGTAAFAIDTAGDVVGMYADANNVIHGFVLPAHGSLAAIDAPGAGTGTFQGTYPIGMDAVGDVAGSYTDASNGIHGFVRTVSGTITSFDAPGSSLSPSVLAGLNSRFNKKASQAARASSNLRPASKKPDSPLNRARAMLSRVGGAPRGNISAMELTGGVFNVSDGKVAGTLCTSIDAAGDVAGIYTGGDDVAHSFLRSAKGSITTFDAPGAGTATAQGTGSFALNAPGTVVGTYADENSVIHGFEVTLAQVATTTALASASASSVYGEPVTLTATVTSSGAAPANGEPVWFMNGATSLGTEPLSGGTASLTTTGLAGGADSITAVYSGDTNLSGSTSTVLSQTVSKATSSITLTSSLNPSNFAQLVTLTATVTGQFGGKATGTVTFKSGTATLGTASLSGNQAGFTTASLPLGASTITAVYGGDTNFSASTSTAVSQTVKQTTPTITWATPLAIPYGTALSATQLDAIASTDGTFAYSPAPGTVPAIGSQTLSVTFTPADTKDFTTAKASVSLTVTAAASTTPTVTVTPSSNSITSLQALDVAAAVNGGTGNPTPTGSVILTSGSYTSDTVPLNNGSATIAIPAGSLAIGTDTLTVTYIPDSASSTTYKSAKGTYAGETVAQGAAPGTVTTLTVTSSGAAATTVTWGSVVSLTATVKAGSTALTTGQVNFCDATAAYCTDVHLLGTAQLTRAGTATLKFKPAIGSHSYKAVFAGTKVYASAASGASALTVTVGSGGGYPSTTSIVESGTVGNYTLTATVGGPGHAAPTGTISFLDSTYGNAVLGTVGLTASQSALSWSSLETPAEASGSYPYSVVVGDWNGAGIPGLVVASSVYTNSGSSGSLTTLLGNGDGTFKVAATLPFAGYDEVSMATGDFNGDGIPDLAYTNRESQTVTVLLGNGDGTFKATAANPATGTGPVFITTGDFNNDGIPDLVVANEDSSSLTILLGHGDGTFKATASNPAAGYYPVGIGIGDFDGDGIQDLVVVSQDSGITILLGNGDGTFRAAASNPTAGYYASSISVGDFNGDGKPELGVGL